MSNFNIQITGSANLTQAQAEFGKLEAQIAALNEEMKKTVTQSRLATNPKPYSVLNRSVAANSQVFRDAMESTGLYRAEQLRINSATEDYTKALQKQKLSFRDWYKSRKVANSAFREQLALQNMVVRQLPTTKNGKSMFDVVVPKDVSSQLATASQKLGFFREQLKSAATQMVNWGKNTQWAGRQLMVGFTVPIAAFGALTGKLAYDVDKQMTRVQKVYNTTADQFSADAGEQAKAQQELDNLRVKSMSNAKRAAEDYGVSMSDTLGVEADLAAVGLKGNNLLGQTTEVMKNATLGEIDYATATKATVGMQQILHLSQKQTSDNWAYMNAVENQTSLSMKDFATAIPIALGPLKQMGGDVQTLGTLLTGMVSRGIAVGKAANGIKAAAQRLLRPSKQVRQEFKDLTGGDITEIARNNKGNLLGMLKDIYSVTKDLGQYKRGKVLAGLFGSNQLATMSAMVDSMGDLEKHVGQISTAYDIGNDSVKNWREIQQKELGAWRKSVSGQFKIAVESIKANLVEMGKPFLQVGTTILHVLDRIVKAFNNLPGGIKKTIAISAIIAAVIGPVVMLTGLFANMIGTTLKFGVALVGLGSKFELLDKESAAARLASKLAAVGFDNEASAAQNTALMVDKLASSLRASAAAQRQYMAMNSGKAGLLGGNQLKNSVARTGVYQENVSDATAGAVRRTTGSTPPNVNNWYTGKPMIPDAEPEKAKKLSTSMKAAAASAGVFSVAMGASMLTSNQTVGHLANIVMAAALLGPAFTGAFRLGQAGLKRLLPMMTRLKSEAYLFMATMSGGGALPKLMGMIRLLGVGLVEAINPITILLAVAGAASYGLYRMWKKQKDIALEQKKTQEAINNSTKTWADILGVVQTKYRQIGVTAPESKDKGMTISDERDAFKKSSQGSRILTSYKSGGADNKAFIAQKMYIDLLTKTNATAKQAQHALEVMFLAAGDGAIKAQTKAAALAASIGKSVDHTDMQRLWSTQISLAWSGTESELKPKATEIGRELSNTIATAANGAGKRNTFDGFIKTFGDSWTKMIRTQLSPRLQSELRDIGITSGKQLQDFYNGQNVSGVDTHKQDQLRLHLYAELGDHAEKLKTTEKQIANEMSDELLLSKPLNTLAKVRATWEWQIYSANKKQLQVMYQQRLEAALRANSAPGERKSIDEVTKRIRKQMAEQMVAMGRANNLQDAYAILAGKSEKKQKDVGNAVKDTANKMSILDQAAAKVDLGSLMHDTMAGIQQEISDNTSAAFDKQMQASLDATQAAGQARMDALQKRQENASESLQARQEAASTRLQAQQEKQSNRLQARQEKASNALEARQQRANDAMDAKFKRREAAVTNAYDKRIKNVQKEIDAEKKADDIRQKLFAAEMSRMDRLNEAANRNIDFNAALNQGNFDEAAKIRNDGSAAADKYNLQDALDASTTKSQNKQDRLSKRIDVLEAAKQKRLDTIAKVEEAEKASLARRQKRETQHLAALQKKETQYLKDRQDKESADQKRRQTRESKALKTHQDKVNKATQREVDMNNKRANTMWQDRKDYLSKALEDFTGYTAMSSKDLLKHIKNWKKKYGGLNLDTKKMFNNTATDINKYLRTQMSDARKKIVNSAAWDNFGDKIAGKMIRGAFNMSKNQFFKWLNGGKPPKAPKPKGHTSGGGNRGGADAKARARVAAAQGAKNRRNTQFRHTGGMIDNSPGSRKGVARSMEGLAKNERNIVSKLGEYMVNDKAVSKYGIKTMDAVNQGKAAIVTEKNVKKNANVHGRARLTTNTANKDASGTDARGGLADVSIYAAGMAATVKGAIEAKIEQAGAEAAARDAAQSVFGEFTAGKLQGMSGDQMRNAATIASVGSKMGMSKRDIEIAFMAAMVESGLHNLNYGDRDSLGLFQERPSQGWGSPKQIMDPAYSAKKFFAYLKTIGGRNRMSMGAAAQAVERSANPGAYAQYQGLADRIWGSLHRSAGGVSGGFVMGKGGRHRPINGPATSGIHDQQYGWPGIDFAGPIGRPVFAVADGTISKSYDIRGYEPRRRSTLGQDGFKSYGRVVYLKTDMGPEVLYAHLDKRNVRAHQRVKGGSVLGRSGASGHVVSSGGTGAHLHFAAKAPDSPRTFLKKGGFTRTIGRATLHEDEVVIDKARTAKLFDGLDVFNDKMGEISNRTVSVTQGNDSQVAPPSVSGAPATSTNQSDNSRRVEDSPVKGTKKKTSVRTGTFNLNKDTSAKGQRADIARLMPRADVLSLTEWEKTARHGGLAKWMNSKGWGVYAAKGGGDYADTAVAWNRKKYKYLQGGTRNINPYVKSKGGGRSRYAAYAELQNRKTGRKFWQIAAHFVNHESKNYPAIIANQMENTMQLYKDLHRTAPVFLAGDFNAPRGGYWKGIGTDAGLPGLTSNYKKKNFKRGTSAHGSKIDQVLTASDIKFMNAQILRGLHSDHDALLTQYNIPGLRKGTMDVKYNNTIANLHAGEGILTKDYNDKFKRGVDNFANGGGKTYNVSIDARGNTLIDPAQIVQQVQAGLQKADRRTPQSRNGDKTR